MADAENILADRIEAFLATEGIVLTARQKSDLVLDNENTISAMGNADVPIHRGRRNARISDDKEGFVSNGITTDGVTTVFMRFDDGSYAGIVTTDLRAA